MNLRIEQIRLDGGTQTRAELSISEINDYAEAMRKGDTFPAIVVFYDGKAYWLADGFHRVQAAISADKKEILADVRQGTKADAVWFSCSANATNGLRRTNEDKRRAVMTALAHPKAAAMSDRQLGEHCGVNHHLVAKVKDASGIGSQIEVRTAIRNGKEYEINTANIGKAKPAPVEEPEDDGDVEPEEDPPAEIFEGDDADVPLPARTQREPGWGDFDVSTKVVEIVALARDFRERLERSFVGIDPRFDTEVRQRTQDALLRVTNLIIDQLPPDGRKATENRSRFVVVNGGK